MEIFAYGVSNLYEETLWKFRTAAFDFEETRVGKARVMREPLTICNTNPRERVLFNRERNPNPFFHLMECIWMFAGDNSSWITKFNKRMEAFMDYGVFHGAYGHRWKNHWGFDQVLRVIDMLKESPGSRRTYISLWNPECDLGQNYKDLPCNVGMTFQVREGKLNGYVFNRSNDIIWGMLGTNCVHFSMLLEVVASAAGLELGKLYQMTANAHMYDRHWDLLKNPASEDDVTWHADYKLEVPNYEEWVGDCLLFTQLEDKGAYGNPFFRDVVVPMFDVFIHRREHVIHDIKATDWRKAAQLWWELNRGKR